MFSLQRKRVYLMDQQLADGVLKRWDTEAVEGGEVLRQEALTAEATKSEQAWWLITAASYYRGQLRWWWHTSSHAPKRKRLYRRTGTGLVVSA
jgi:hypothetical protein